MERGAAKLAPLRGAQTDAAPFPAPRTDVTARSTGLKSNGNVKSNGNFKNNCNGNFKSRSNGNCRCAYVKSNGNYPLHLHNSALRRIVTDHRYTGL